MKDIIRMQKLAGLITEDQTKKITTLLNEIDNNLENKELSTSEFSPEFLSLIKSYKEYIANISREDMFDNMGNYNPTLKKYHKTLEKYSNEGSRDEQLVANWVLGWI
jgi:hypothetical protein